MEAAEMYLDESGDDWAAWMAAEAAEAAGAGGAGPAAEAHAAGTGAEAPADAAGGDARARAAAVLRRLHEAGWLDVEVRTNYEQFVTLADYVYRYIAARPHRTVLLYLGGYHNRPRRELLVKLAEAARLRGRTVEFLHWGDIDLGGFRIFAHLRRRTGLPLRPLLMDRETYLAHAARGLPFDDAYARRLAALRPEADYAPFHGVIDEMLPLGRRIEQEAVPPPST